MNKKIALAVTIVLIVGAIWYLESIQAHPGAGGPAQNINVSATASANASGSAVASAGSAATGAVNASLQSIAAADAAAGYQPAHEIVDPTGFVNASSSFNLASLVGKKVILLDFWTYSCINCIRTLPYLTAWYQKYQNQGLEVVGIHTPEFDFEKDINNVQAAATQYGIKYPVVLDSNYGTWQAYGNLYWPHEYLIDIAGYIVHDQVGEGSYGETEAEIQKLLVQRDQVLGMNAAAVPTSTVNITPANLSGDNSPETYFGSARNQFLGNGTPGLSGTQSFNVPTSLNPNTLYLGGSWNILDQYAETTGSSDQVDYNYNARGVYFVAGTDAGAAASGTVEVEVLRDGKPIDKSVAGSDIVYKNGRSYIEVSGQRLYRLIDDPSAGAHSLELIIGSPGLQAFTFTFG